MSSASLHNFQHEGITFVAGLFWQPLSGNNASERKSEIKMLAAEMQFDLHILTASENSFTVGFAKSNGVAKSGYVSIASVISKAISNSGGGKDFLVAKMLPDGKWLYLCQKDGIILADGDVVFSNEDGARARMLQDSRIADWETILCPAEWSIKGAADRDFNDLLPRKDNGKLDISKDSKLAKINVNGFIAGNKVLLLTVAALAIAGIYGYDYKLQLDKKRALELQQAMLAAQNNAEATPVAPNPWKQKRLPVEMLETCQTALGGVHLFPGNWSLTNVHCTDSTLTITWAPKTGGWISHLQQIEPRIVIAFDGASASLTVPLAEATDFTDEPLLDSNQRLLEMYAAAQRYGVKLTAKPPPPPPVALPGQENAVVTNWAEIEWKAEEVKFPMVVLRAFEGNGMRLKSMDGVWQNGSLIWTMEGNQYVKS